MVKNQHTQGKLVKLQQNLFSDKLRFSGYFSKNYFSIYYVHIDLKFGRSVKGTKVILIGRFFQILCLSQNVQTLISICNLVMVFAETKCVGKLRVLCIMLCE